MALPNPEELDEYSSDEDFFFGPLTLREVKKHILWNKTRRIIPCSFKSSEQDKTFKIIETHSESNSLHARTTPGSSSSKSSNPDIRTSDDTFIQSENVVAGCSKSHDQAESKLELNNTSEDINYILHHGPPKENDKSIEIIIEDDSSQSDEDVIIVEDIPTTSINCMSLFNVNIPCINVLTPSNTDQQNTVEHFYNSQIIPSPEIRRKKSTTKLFKTHVPTASSTTHLKVTYSRSKAYDHICSPVAAYIHNTPQFPIIRDVHPKKPRTSSIPKYTSTLKKTISTPNLNVPSIAYRSARKTQVIDIPDQGRWLNCEWAKNRTSKAYDHIRSPVAAYIHNTPQFPIVRDVHPKKTLTSSIPKYTSTLKKTISTPNLNLPSIAYRSAKNTQVIDIPDQERLPNCEWAKKINSKLLKPIVMKHTHREEDFTRKPLSPKQEDSFPGLPYHQADLSVCTLKSAMNLKKH